MSTLTLEEAQAKLPELIDQLALGEEVIITRNQQPVGRIALHRHACFSSLRAIRLRQRRFGLGQPEGHIHDAVEVDGGASTNL